MAKVTTSKGSSSRLKCDYGCAAQGFMVAWQFAWALVFITNITAFTILPSLREWSAGYLFLLHFATITGVLGVILQISLVCVKFLACGAVFKRTRWFKGLIGALIVTSFFQLMYLSVFFWAFASTSGAPAVPMTWDATVKGKRRVAVIGGGPSGVSAAMSLVSQPDKFEVSLFEAESQLGGHGYGTPFNYTDTKGVNQSVNIDMGFIFGGAGAGAYEAMRCMMKTLGVKAKYSGIDISNSDRTTGAMLYATNQPETWPEGEFARFYELLLATPDASQMLDVLFTFGEWMDMHEFGDDFRAKYCTPMFMTLFIIKTGMFEMPFMFMRNMFLKFIDFYYATPAWVVEGSSRVMYDFATEFLNAEANVYLSTPAHVVTRLEDGRVEVTLQDGSSDIFDAVILAVQADISKELLRRGGTSSMWEQAVLKQVAYDGSSNMVLHTDRSFLPDDPKYWKNFNFQIHGEGDFTHRNHFEFNALMSRVFGLDIDYNVSDVPILTTNPIDPIPEDKIIDVKTWYHHQQDTYHFLMVVLFFPYLHSSSVAFAGEWLEAIGHNTAMTYGATASTIVGGMMTDSELVALKEKHGWSGGSPPCDEGCHAGCISPFEVCPADDELTGDTPLCYNPERQPTFQCVESEEMYRPFPVWVQDVMVKEITAENHSSGVVGDTRRLLGALITVVWVSVVGLGLIYAVLKWLAAKDLKNKHKGESAPTTDDDTNTKQFSSDATKPLKDHETAHMEEDAHTFSV